jgi:hypothetical protein
VVVVKVPELGPDDCLQINVWLRILELDLVGRRAGSGEAERGLLKHWREIRQR